MKNKIKSKGKPSGGNKAMTGASQGNTSQVTGTTDNQPMLIFKGQYVKNIEFNSSGLPRNIKEEPKTSLNFHIKANQLEQDIHEVDFSVVAHVGTDKEKIVTIQVNYGVLYQLKNIPTEQQEAVLVSEGGRLIYPYVQRLMADIMREGGIPAFQLPPVDFLQAYKQSKKQQVEK